MAATLPRTNPSSSNGYDPFRRKGSDPLISTARGKLQTKRSKLNDEINRELRMRNGAENLFKATNNKNIKETVALELSFVNSNLQVLKEEMAELNSTMDVYQSGGGVSSVPMIPMGLKETKDVDIGLPFLDYIQEHYSEEPRDYADEVQELASIRQAIRTPQRNPYGIELLYDYYNQLYFVEKRFFPPDRSLGVYFEWYDSLTGVPSAQRTVGFEKGGILFNIGALHTQIACQQDRANKDGIKSAINNFEKAAGAFKYLHDNFSNAPSMDMQPQTLAMLVQLMLAQTQECVLEELILGGVGDGIEKHLEVAHEAAMVSQMYEEAYKQMSQKPVKDYAPFPWTSMCQVKAQHFGAMSHYYAVTGLLDQKDSNDVHLLEKLFGKLHVEENENTSMLSRVPSDEDDKKQLARAHLKDALLLHEEALKHHDRCKHLRKIDTFQEVLKHAHDRSLKKFSDLEEEDDFTEVSSSPSIKSKTAQHAKVIMPDFARYKVTDLFHKLGPVAIFSAKHEWSSPRDVSMQKSSKQGYGFSVRGDSPVIVAQVDQASLAQNAGMKIGDFIIGVNGQDTKWSKHEDVVTLIKESGNSISVKLITPRDRNYLEPHRTPCSRAGSTCSDSSFNIPSTSASPSNTLSSTKSGNKRSKKGESGKNSSSWLFKKKSPKRETDEMEKVKY
ncbi:unnamed protein product [Owenia fusiformis]|uniref:Uncharacterized protein n=1 Tax=Owenia fusiformis TaxID=6347 RepID=A0A8J1TUF2_OWEFU|nr:unnamed protein product [Owenia fusiformis]